MAAFKCLWHIHFLQILCGGCLLFKNLYPCQDFLFDLLQSVVVVVVEGVVKEMATANCGGPGMARKSASRVL